MSILFLFARKNNINKLIEEKKHEILLAENKGKKLGKHCSICL